jgi:hypothetical protein
MNPKQRIVVDLTKDRNNVTVFNVKPDGTEKEYTKQRWSFSLRKFEQNDRDFFRYKLGIYLFDQLWRWATYIVSENPKSGEFADGENKGWNDVPVDKKIGVYQVRCIPKLQEIGIEVGFMIGEESSFCRPLVISNVNPLFMPNTALGGVVRIGQCSEESLYHLIEVLTAQEYVIDIPKLHEAKNGDKLIIEIFSTEEFGIELEILKKIRENNPEKWEESKKQIEETILLDTIGISKSNDD